MLLTDVPLQNTKVTLLLYAECFKCHLIVRMDQNALTSMKTDLLREMDNNELVFRF